MPTLKATVADFISAYDDLEAIFLADPDTHGLDPDLQDIALTGQERLQLALDDADGELQRYYLKSLPMGRAMIQSGYRRMQLRIARYLLDTVKARQSIKEDYEKVISTLEKISEDKDNVQLTEDEALMLGVDVKQSRRIQYDSNERVFTRDNLTGYRRDKLFFR